MFFFILNFAYVFRREELHPTFRCSIVARVQPPQNRSRPLQSGKWIICNTMVATAACDLERNIVFDGPSVDHAMTITNGFAVAPYSYKHI